MLSQSGCLPKPMQGNFLLKGSHKLSTLTVRRGFKFLNDTADAICTWRFGELMTPLNRTKKRSFQVKVTCKQSVEHNKHVCKVLKCKLTCFELFFEGNSFKRIGRNKNTGQGSTQWCFASWAGTRRAASAYFPAQNVFPSRGASRSFRPCTNSSVYKPFTSKIQKDL